MSLKVKTVFGQEIEEYIESLAKLRIEVFREYPYLYDGSLQYEQKYLETYMSSQSSMAVLVFDNYEIVGVSTGIPLSEETEEFKEPFFLKGLDADQIFYCGESVLKKEYRGQGIYKEFFKRREDYAASFMSIRQICFCAVERPEDHPLKPQGYISFDAVWTKYGYTKRDELNCLFPWKDIDQNEETLHPMKFWTKDLGK